jgi:O-antigen ligase
MMAWIERWILYMLFLTVGTYAVPELRVVEVPYTVPIAVFLAAWLGIEWILGQSFHLRPWLVITTAIYVLSILLSTTFAESPNWPMALKYAMFAMIPLVVCSAARDVATVHGCLVCLMISALAVFVYGVYGYFSGAVGDPIEHQFGYFGVTYMASTRNSDQLYLLVPTCVFMVLFLQGGGRWGLGMVAFVCLFVLIVAVVMSYARGAWMATAIVGIMTLRRVYMTGMVNLRRRVGLLTLILVGSASLFFARLDAENAYRLRERYETFFTLDHRFGSNSNENRVNIGILALNMGVRDPLFGVGVGNARYGFAASGYPVNHAENVYLQLFAEQGILGLGAYAALLLWTYRRLKRRLCIAMTPLMDAQSGAVLIAMVVYGFFNSFVDNTWFWAVIALVVAQANLVVRHPASRPGPQPRTSKGAVAGDSVVAWSGPRARAVWGG